jgi:hypothetical protein
MPDRDLLMTDTRNRPSFPNPDRLLYWPGEEHHYRSNLKIGDVARMKYGAVGRIVAFNNTWSHITGGRLVHLDPVLAYEGPAPANAHPYGHNVSWEVDLSVAQPGDVSAHTVGTPPAIRHVSANWAR